MNHNAYLYSFANAKESFRPVEWKLIDLATVTVDDIKVLARYMLTKSEMSKPSFWFLRDPTLRMSSSKP